MGTDVVVHDVPCRGGEVIHEGFSILCANRRDYSAKRTHAAPINPFLIDYLHDRILRCDLLMLGNNKGVKSPRSNEHRVNF